MIVTVICSCACIRSNACDSDSDFLIHVCVPYKHSSSDPPEGLQRPATLWRPGMSQPLGGTVMGWNLGLQRASGSWPPESLLLASLTILCHFLFSASVVLTPNSRLDAAILPPSVAQVGFQLTPQTVFCFKETAWWRPRGPPHYIQWPSSRPMVGSLSPIATQWH